MKQEPATWGESHQHENEKSRHAGLRNANQLWLLPMLCLCSCASLSPMQLARDVGAAGWFQADGSLRWQALDRHANCDRLGANIPDDEGNVVIVVPGVKGDGDEIASLLATVSTAKPSAVFLFRWVPWDERDRVAQDFAVGVSRLLECAPWIDGHLLVVAHSAGGLVVGYGATRLDIPNRVRNGPALYALTVAAPLAGVNVRPSLPNGEARERFMLDFATDITSYPVAPAAMSIVHLRTRFPSDVVMKPVGTHSPNDVNVGIPGARQVDLPGNLTHCGALQFVAGRIADGTWLEWFTEDEAGGAASSSLQRR